MFTIIPNQVGFDKNLNFGSKLLYGNILSFTNNNRVVFASNKYFAELYNVSPRTIQRWLQELKDNGYITIDFKELDNGNQTRVINATNKVQLANASKAQKKVLEEATADYLKKMSSPTEPNKYNQTTIIKDLPKIWQE